MQSYCRQCLSDRADAATWKKELEVLMPGGTAPAPREDYLRGPKELGDDMAAGELNDWLSMEL